MKRLKVGDSYDYRNGSLGHHAYELYSLLNAVSECDDASFLRKTVRVVLRSLHALSREIDGAVFDGLFIAPSFGCFGNVNNEHASVAADAVLRGIDQEKDFNFDLFVEFLQKKHQEGVEGRKRYDEHTATLPHNVAHKSAEMAQNKADRAKEKAILLQEVWMQEHE